MHALSDQKLLAYRKQFTQKDQEFSKMFKALSDVHRYHIFVLLMGPSRLSIGSIARILDISVPLTSQHLQVLVHAKLLQKEREGKKIYPKLERGNPFVKKLLSVLRRLPYT